MTHTIEWIDFELEPKCSPNPAYPDGIDIELDNLPAGTKTCKVSLPYPAKRIGVHIVQCSDCGLSVAITTAGRADDPRSVKLVCNRQRLKQ